MSTEPVETFDPADIEKNKTMAGLAYILFFLPLITCPDSKFAKFHANQSLILLICNLGGSIVLGLIPVVGFLLRPLFALACLALLVIGLLNGINGRSNELPLIGKYRLLK